MDLTDAQWAILEPTFRPRRRPDGHGRPWTDPRAVLKGVLWVLRTGAPWADLPARYPPLLGLLAAFRRDLQADAYKGYDALYRTGRIRELGSWAHARRRFDEALPTEARAAPMIALIQQLYQIERAIADESVEVRRQAAHFAVSWFEDEQLRHECA